MNKVMIDNWNNVVSDDDTVYHMGDVALGKWVEWDGILSQLNGYKVLVIGNHDRIFKGMNEKHRRRFSVEYSKWFDESYDNIEGFTLSDGTVANLSHFPYDGDSHDGDRFTEVRLRDKGEILIHGHTHRNQIVSHSMNGSLQIHVGADAWNYTPVSEDQIISLINGIS